VFSVAVKDISTGSCSIWSIVIEVTVSSLFLHTFFWHVWREEEMGIYDPNSLLVYAAYV
jgi:hypothetical protein